MRQDHGYVKTQIIDRIAVIEFFHPKGNSMPGILLDQLQQQISEASHNKEVKAIVLSSAGMGAFCAGASFDELLSLQDNSNGEAFFKGFAGVMHAIESAPMFVLCRIQGKLVGGGLGLAAACDYTIATQAAAVKLSELAIGIGPFVIGGVVGSKIGVSGLASLALNPEKWYSAEWALEKGLFHQLCSNIMEMDETIEKLLMGWRNYSTEAMHEIKLMLKNQQQWRQADYAFNQAAISGRLALSAHTQAILKLMKQKAR